MCFYDIYNLTSELKRERDKERKKKKERKEGEREKEKESEKRKSFNLIIKSIFQKQYIGFENLCE